MEAKFENLTISDKPLLKTNSTPEVEEDSILAYIKADTKKYELNVNAKEFVPRTAGDSSSHTSQSVQTNPDETPTPRALLNAKNGDDNHKPIFMNGMTEKFIQGPYVGNGRDAEIPYIRYFSNGQTLDFYNKKYFSNGNSGEITFKPYDGNSEQVAESYPGPLFTNGFADNIFKPPFINALVSDILCRQYCSYLWPKTSPLFVPPRRGYGGKPNVGPASQRPSLRAESVRVPKLEKKTAPVNGSQEEWYAEESSANGPGTSDSSDLEITVDGKNLNCPEEHETEKLKPRKNAIPIECPEDTKSGSAEARPTNDSRETSPQKDDKDSEIIDINGCSIVNKSKELLTEHQSPFLDNTAESVSSNEVNRDSSVSNPSGSETFSDASSSLSDREQDMPNPGIDKSRGDVFFQNARSATHS